MVIQTRVVLGTRDTPHFVTKEFYEAMHLTTSIYQYDFTLRPDTIAYHIPAHMVVDRFEPMEKYSIFVCDGVDVPMCQKRKTLDADIYVHKTPKFNFDRFRVFTEDVHHQYYLLTPNARYYDTTIYRQWEIRHLIYQNIAWDVSFRHVHVDPHDTRQTIWFFSHPKYQIELVAQHDFRENTLDMKQAIMAILPHSFR